MVLPLEGLFAPLSGASVTGYEIHMGKSEAEQPVQPLVRLENGITDGGVCNNVFGSYLHGLFDSEEFRRALVSILLKRKGLETLTLEVTDYEAYKQQQYDKLAQGVRDSLEMEQIYRILEEGV